MKKYAAVLSVMILSLPLFLKAVPSDYDEIRKKITEGRAVHQELLEAQKKCYREYIGFFRQKYAQCTLAQEKRNAFLNDYAKGDKAFAPSVVKFNSGLVRNALDKKLFSDVYKKFAENKDFMLLDRNLWEAKTQAAFSSVKSQLSQNNSDPEYAYHTTLQSITDALEKSAIGEMTKKYISSTEKGSSLYQAAMEEIRNYKKAADPREMAKARRNISLYTKHIFQQALQQYAPELEKLMKEGEKLNKERIRRELELELNNKDAAYARYLNTFGINLPVKG